MTEFHNLPDFNPNRLTETKNKHFVKLMRQKYILYWQHTIQNSKKLEFYNTFKNEYTPCCYLSFTRKLNGRKELVKLRIGNHKLIIETGRYDQISRFGTLFPTCGSNQVEDEIHFLFSCPKYSILRNRFYSNIKNHLIIPYRSY